MSALNAHVWGLEGHAIGVVWLQLVYDVFMSVYVQLRLCGVCVCVCMCVCQGSQRELSSPGSEASAALLSSAMDAGKLEAVMTIVRKNT